MGRHRVILQTTCRICHRPIEIRSTNAIRMWCPQCKRDYKRRLKLKTLGNAWKDVYKLLGKRSITTLENFINDVATILDEV